MPISYSVKLAGYAEPAKTFDTIEALASYLGALDVVTGITLRIKTSIKREETSASSSDSHEAESQVGQNRES